MILYYQGARARITDKVFQTTTPQVQTFAISELRYIHVAGDTSGRRGDRWKTDPRPYELWAIYRNRFVCLYAELDRRTFIQVTRALKRLLEHRADAQRADREGWVERDSKAQRDRWMEMV
jgi:hypothetical protein